MKRLRWLLLCLSLLQATHVMAQTRPDFIEVQPFPAGGDFTLHSDRGAVSLHDFKGKAVLLFFGYTYCPDICPMTLGTLSITLEQLRSDERTRVEVLFITLDPERDTTKHLAAYLAHFGFSATGLTGSKPEIDQVVDQYAAQYTQVELPGSAMRYGLDHSAGIYLVSPEGRLLHVFRHTANPKAMAQAIRKILK